MTNINGNRLILLGCIFLFMIGQTIVSISIPLEAAVRGARTSQIGFIIGLPGFISLIADIPLSVWSDRGGRERAVRYGAGLAACSVFFFAPSSSLLGLVLLTGLSGLAGSLYGPPVLAAFSSSLMEENQARFQGYNGALQGFSAVLGVFLAVNLAEYWDFRAAFYAAGLLFLVVFVLTGHLRFDPESNHKNEPIASILTTYHDAAGMLMRNPKIQLAVLMEIIYAIVIVIVGNSFFPLYVTETLHSSTSSVGNFLGVRNSLGILTSLFFGAIAFRFGLMKMVIITLSLASVALLLVPFAPGSGALFLLLGLQGIGAGFIPAAPNVLAAEGTKLEERALGYATVMIVSRLFMMIAPVIFGFFAEYWNMRVLFQIGGGTSMLLLLGMIALERLRRKQHCPTPAVVDERSR